MLKKENRPAQAAEVAFNKDYSIFQPEKQSVSMYQGFKLDDAGKTARMVDILQAIKAGRWAEHVLRLRKLDSEGRAAE